MSLTATGDKTYFVESGSGERLSDMLDEDTARSIAISSRERLCRLVVDDGETVGDELVFDYGVSEVNPADDRGAQRCDECGNWSVGLVSAGHDSSCSLNPQNIVN